MNKRYSDWIGSSSSSAPSKQSLLDAILATADYGLSALPSSNGQGGAYKDNGLTSPAIITGDAVIAFRGLGNNPVSPSLVTMPTPLPLKSTYKVWYDKYNSSPNLVPTFINRGNFDAFVMMSNGPLTTSGYGPGSDGNTNYASAVTNPIDVIIALRYTNHLQFEVTANWKDNGGLLGYNNYFSGTTGPNPYMDQIWRFFSDAAGNWQLWLNGISMGTGTSGTISFPQLLLGTTSHVMQHHFRYILYKFGGPFPANDLNTIYTNSQALWPWTVPAYPYITNFWQAAFPNWNGTGFQVGNGYGGNVFSGGNGIEGTHLYQWYFNDTNSPTRFPSTGNAASQTGTNWLIPASIDITTIASTNTISSLTMDGVQLLGSTVTFATSAAATATALAAAINSGPQSANFQGEVANSTVVRIYPVNNNYATNTLAVITSGFTPTLVQCPNGNTLVVSTYSVKGQIYFGHTADATIIIMCLTTPKDSAGLAGEPIVGGWWAKNF